MAMHAVDGRYRGARILVTGATGFLGTGVCRALLPLGAEVHAISRTPPARVEGEGGPRWHAGDVSDMATVEAAVRAADPSVVFHLTSHGFGSPELANVLPSVQGDLISTVNVLTAVAQRGTGRVVIAASLEEPAAGRAVPVSPYAAAKWAATGYARMFHTLYQTDVVIARVFMTYGPGQRAHKLVPYVIRSLLRRETPKLSSGRRRVDWVYVDDVVRGLLLAGALPGVEGCELDFGSGEFVPVRELVERIAQLIDSSADVHFGALADRPLEVERRADAAETLRRIGWRAEVPLEDGLRHTVDWFRLQEQGARCAS